MEGEPVIDLAPGALAELAARGLDTPGYDRTALVPRIVHIGVGGFHRAHLALYCHLLAQRGGDWGICGLGLLAGDQAMADALAAQGHLYTFTEKGTGTRRSRVVGSIVDFAMAADDAEPAVARVAADTTRIVSMTVTEAGYDPTPRNQQTFDVIAAGLDRRRRSRAGGVTILSCDNVRGNGDAARRCVLEAARRHDAGLADWVGGECTFPNSMVDRITPQTADEDRRHLVDEFGLADRWPVVAEPFWQWVLEDEFAAGRPDFDEVGVLFSDGVHAWELYKLRLLNAGHSAIAYLSALADITYVDEALATPEVREFLTRLLLDEALPTLDPIPGHPPEDYVATVLARFANTGVRDQIARLCIDGTSKFPTFLMPTIERQLELGGPVARSALALAGWAHYLASVPIERQAHDSLGDQSRSVARSTVSDPAAFVDERTGFPRTIAENDRFRDAFVTAHRAIADHGPLGALTTSLDG